MPEDICETARKKAIQVLKSCTHKLGILASGGPPDRSYQQVWARDSMITLLGALYSGSKKIMKALQASFETLAAKRTIYGCIPNNVSLDGKANFQAYADSGLWFVIGTNIFFETTKDEKFLRKYFPVVKDVMKFYEYQDVDQTNLITMAEASDWQDMLAVRGKGLYVNVLYYTALQKASKIASELGHRKLARDYSGRAEKVKSAINHHFWYEGMIERRHLEFGYGMEMSKLDRLRISESGKKLVWSQKEVLREESYYLPYLSFRNFGEWFDSFGNLLTIIAGVADRKRSERILQFIDRFNLAKPFPIKSIYPPIKPGDKDWREYYRDWGLNLPHRYHNGGIWPFLGGFYILALQREGRHEEASQNLIKLAELNKKGKEGEWEFNEWFHGKTAKPMGMAKQAWSAGMYLCAYEAVTAGRIPI